MKNKIKSHIKEGVVIEMEHKNTIKKIKDNPNMSVKEAAELIAKDHLKEDPNYYNKLKAAKLEKGKKIKDIDDYHFYIVRNKSNDKNIVLYIKDKPEDDETKYHNLKAGPFDTEVEARKFLLTYKDRGLEKSSLSQLEDLIDEAYPTDAENVKKEIEKSIKDKGIKTSLYKRWEEKFGETIDESIKNKDDNDSLIRTGKTIRELVNDEIRSDYPTKDPEIIWNEWSIEQRDHFLYDHNDQTKLLTVRDRGEMALSKYNELTKDVKNALGAHIKMGRYERGYKVTTKALKDSIQIGNIKMQSFGVSITPYNPDEETYVMPINLTNYDLISLAMSSLKERGFPLSEIESTINGYVKYLLSDI